MKRNYYSLIALAGILFSFFNVHSQAPKKIYKYDRNVKNPSQIIKGKEYDIPGKGKFNSPDVMIQKAGDTYPFKSTGSPKPSQVGTTFYKGIGSGYNISYMPGDIRNLPLNAQGQLLSVDGFPVEFNLPQNPNDPGGICATPNPEIVFPQNASVAANCPFVVPCDNPVNRDASIPLPGQPIKYIKLRWVVVLDGSGPSSNIDQTRIDQLMAELNSDFTPWRIQFCADPATFVTDAAMYSLNAGTEDGTLKTTYGTNPTDWMNVYVVGSITNPNAGGYARFPYDPFGGTNIRGGLVLARGNMFLGTHTVAHEVGHTFGLYHTFHGVDEVTPCTACYEDMGLAGQDTEGDWCSDTGPHPTNSYICGDAGTDGCSGFPWAGSPVNNHMSYSFCTSQFTPQQAGRMHCMVDSYLQSWVNYGGATCGSLPPVADFVGTPTLWQAPMTVQFTDLSVPATTITSWTWNFDVTGIGGVAPATFVGQTPPPVVYSVCDTQYTVSLTVSNINGSDTETKIAYITPLCPAGDCDTLDDHWVTPTSTPTFYQYAANDYVTGIPSPTQWQGFPGFPLGFYERYPTPNPGVTTVGAVRVGLGNYLDPDSNTIIQVLVYNCDAAGNPDASPIGGVGGINPGADLGVPGAGFYNEFWIPFECDLVVDSANFLVAVEMFPGNVTDRLILVSSQHGQGQNLGLNYTLSPGWGYENYLTNIGLNFDLDLVPMLGPWPTEMYITGLGGLIGCDTTLIMIVDTALYQGCETSVSFTSNMLGTLQDTVATGIDTIFLLYTGPGPDTLTFATINSCGRTDTAIYYLTYPFDTIPNPDFTMSNTNPVCAGTPVCFTGTPTGMGNYLWDFGDGTVFSSGASNTTCHTYTTPGLYYVTLTVTTPAGCPGTITKLDFVEIIDCSVNAPLAGFDPQPNIVCLGDPILFVDTSQAVPDPATSWFWAFDDGTFSLLQNPSHTYTSAGIYNVMLVASNAGGSDTVYIQVEVQDPCLLPEGIVLNAEPVYDAVVLNWLTSPDLNVYDFDIERSLNGVIFNKIGEVRNVDINQSHLYSYIDNGALKDVKMYYRLKEISLNGGFEYSNIATAILNSQSSDWIKIYPNPSNEGMTINLDAYLLKDDHLKISIYDIQGKALYETEQFFNAGLGRTQLETSSLAKGTYLVRVNTSDNVLTEKLIVK